jgi:hypothetical protein
MERANNESADSGTIVKEAPYLGICTRSPVSSRTRRKVSSGWPTLPILARVQVNRHGVQRNFDAIARHVPGEFRIRRHSHPRVQDELSQSFDFLIFKRGNSIQTELV